MSTDHDMRRRLKDALAYRLAQEHQGRPAASRDLIMGASLELAIWRRRAAFWERIAMGLALVLGAALMGLLVALGWI